MIMIVKTPGSQMGSPVAAEEGGEEVGGERVEREVQARSTLSSTAPKARSRSGEVATLDEMPRDENTHVYIDMPTVRSLQVYDHILASSRSGCGKPAIRSWQAYSLILTSL